MANKTLESTVLAIEEQSAIDKDGNPTFTKKEQESDFIPLKDPRQTVRKLRGYGIISIIKH